MELLTSSITSLQASLTEERERRLIAEEQVVHCTKQNSQLQEDLQSEKSVRIAHGSKLRDLTSLNMTLKQQLNTKKKHWNVIKLDSKKSRKRS